MILTSEKVLGYGDTKNEAKRFIRRVPYNEGVEGYDRTKTRTTWSVRLGVSTMGQSSESQGLRTFRDLGQRTNHLLMVRIRFMIRYTWLFIIEKIYRHRV